MQKIKYIFAFLIIFSFSLQNGFALERDYCWKEAYYGKEYCISHQPPTIIFHLIKKYISLIPSSSGQCLHVQCKNCPHVWVEFHEKENGSTEMLWNCQCKDKLLGKNYKQNLNKWMSDWTQCNQRSIIYAGYLSDDYLKFSSFFYEYLQYIDQNQSCKCYWPEISNKAATVNNTAYKLFRKLFKSTDLIEMVHDLDQQRELFITAPIERCNLHEQSFLSFVIVFCIQIMIGYVESSNIIVIHIFQKNLL